MVLVYSTEIQHINCKSKTKRIKMCLGANAVCCVGVGAHVILVVVWLNIAVLIYSLWVNGVHSGQNFYNLESGKTFRFLLRAV